jgi:hypothetical protein
MMKAASVLVSLLVAGCAAAPPTAPRAAAAANAPTQGAAAAADPLAAVRAQRDLEILAVFLEGTWDTVPQAEKQGVSTPMRLRFARLWPERSGEYWLYAEYVNPADERQVLRQRIFRWTRDGDRIESRLYRLPGDAASFAGEWRKARPFERVDPARLREAEGCRSLWTRQMESVYAGGTLGNNCQGDRPEVRHEHSDFYVSSTSIRGWIRGLDASGKQVDGPIGPSEFRKTAQKPR